MKVLPNPLIGLCFLKRNNAIFDIRQGILTFPHLSMQLKPEHNLPTRQSTPLLAEATYTLEPGKTMLFASKIPHLIDHDATGIVTTSTHLEDHDTLFRVSSLCTFNNNAVGYQICNFSELPYTITTDSHLADFRVLTPEQLKYIKPINPATITFIMHQHTEDTDVYLNELLKDHNKEDKTEHYWFTTPEQPGDPTTYTPIQKRIFDELVELQALENLTHKTMNNHAKHFLIISIGKTQHSHCLNNKKWNNCSLSFTTLSPDTGLTLEQTENSKSNSHQTMTDQHIAKVFQPRSI